MPGRLIKCIVNVSRRATDGHQRNPSNTKVTTARVNHSAAVVKCSALLYGLIAMSSMALQTGLIGDKNGQLKRKLSGDIAECGSNLDLFNLQRELLLTQNELRLLRQQYFQLRQVCQESMQVMASASNSSVFTTKSDLLAKQPGIWQGVSVPVAKRRAILDQVTICKSCLSHCQLQMLCSSFDASHLTTICEFI